ncbi:MAG: MoaD/ThiS family protein [Dehalococcoidia bacterium]
MIKLKLRPPLTRIIGVKEISVNLREATLREVLDAASAEYPKFKKAIYEDDGSFSPAYKFIVNGESINLRDDLDTMVSEDDDIFILMPIAGG